MYESQLLERVFRNCPIAFIAFSHSSHPSKMLHLSLSLISQLYKQKNEKDSVSVVELNNCLPSPYKSKLVNSIPTDYACEAVEKIIVVDFIGRLVRACLQVD